MNANIQKENCLLSVTNLQKSFGKLKVLQGVDIDINKGDVVAVIGPSGCGKSTFLRCLNLLETPSAGSIVLENEYVFKNERIFLKEKLTPVSIICTIGAVLGAVLISGVFGGGNVSMTGITLGLIAAMLYASIIILNKKISDISGIERT